MPFLNVIRFSLKQCKTCVRLILNCNSSSRWSSKKESPRCKLKKTIVALSVIVGENWAGPTGRGSRPIPFKFRTTDYLSDPFWIFPLKKDWLVSIRLSPLFLVNLHKNTLSNLRWLGQDILPTSINWDAIHLYPRDEWFWLFMIPLPSLHICVSRDFFGRILRF